MACVHLITIEDHTSTLWLAIHLSISRNHTVASLQRRQAGDLSDGLSADLIRASHDEYANLGESRVITVSDGSDQELEEEESVGGSPTSVVSAECDDATNVSSACSDSLPPLRLRSLAALAPSGELSSAIGFYALHTILNPISLPGTQVILYGLQISKPTTLI
ncbi:hypothetical protein ETB97_000428 [Aspergillus alliaceus]|uniref:Uncharacterized protein n=1 Tax=Petromyces alliaceus TaxID=209559 RepID=A0A8H6A5U1_PETAA|nr:hypothetical protein ETB97_000428 [Aspergillus burnettii]